MRKADRATRRRARARAHALAALLPLMHPHPYPATSYTIGDSKEKAVGLSGSILHSWRNWVLTYTSRFTLVGKIRLRCSLLVVGSTTLGKR